MFSWFKKKPKAELITTITTLDACTPEVPAVLGESGAMTLLLDGIAKWRPASLDEVCDFCDRLCRTYFEANADLRSKLRRAVAANQAVRNSLLGDSLKHAVSTPDYTTYLRSALLAISLTGGCVDPLDTRMWLAELWRQAEEQGVDPEPHYRQIGGISSTEAIRTDLGPTEAMIVQMLDERVRNALNLHFWRCSECGCTVKHFLGICWKCGAARPGGEVARQASLETERDELAQPRSVHEAALKGLPREESDRCKRDMERALRRIDLARSVVLATIDHVAGSQVVDRLGTVAVTGEERRSAAVLGDYYGEGYHGELHHADYRELALFMIIYKAHQLGANAVLNVTLTPPPPNDYVASGETVVIEPG